MVKVPGARSIYLCWFCCFCHGPPREDCIDRGIDRLLVIRSMWERVCVSSYGLVAASQVILR